MFVWQVKPIIKKKGETFNRWIFEMHAHLVMSLWAKEDHSYILSAACHRANRRVGNTANYTGWILIAYARHAYVCFMCSTAIGVCV